MGYLEGFVVTLQAAAASSSASPRQYPKDEGGKRAQAGAPPRPPRPQPLRGRHGEVHRLRAVRRRLPGPLHLRPRRRQPARPTRSRPASATASSTRSTTCAASTATCASRPAPPRPSPSRSCSSSPSPTGPTPSTPRPSSGRRRRPAPAAAVGGLDDASDVAQHTSAWMRATSPARRRRLRGPGRPGPASSASACGRPRPGQTAPTPTPGQRARSPRRRPAHHDGTARWPLMVDGRRLRRRRGHRAWSAPSASIALAATRSTPPSAWWPPCSASPCCSSPRRPTSWPPCRSSSTPAPSSCCSCS